jgi:type II secretion system protein N
MNSILDTSETTQSIDTQMPEPRSKKILRNSAWVLYGIFCLIIFTLFKMPEDRLKATIENQISGFLSSRDITYTAGETKLSFLFGLSYTMRDITLNLPPPANKAHIDKIQVSPSLLPLLFGKIGGSVDINNGDGNLSSSFSVKNSEVSVSFRVKKLDLGKLGLLPLLAGIQGSALLDGNGSISGDMNLPSTLTGDVKANIAKINIEPQSLMGFSIPKLQISEGIVDLDINKAKATIKTLRVGKTGSSDDIQANITGDADLGKNWYSSNLNLKAKFSLSESILKSFVLLDAILGIGKQPDGSYGFTITGPVTSPMPAPLVGG